MSVIRWILGRIILLLNWVFQPKGVKRSADIQAKIDNETSNMALYQYEACPFCVKVRRAMKRQSLKIETRNAKSPSPFADELVANGGQQKVPCLRIQNGEEDVWMYESSEIIKYLETKFA